MLEALATLTAGACAGVTTELLAVSVLLALLLDVVFTVIGLRRGLHENNFLGLLQRLMRLIGPIPALVLTHALGAVAVILTYRDWGIITLVGVNLILWVYAIGTSVYQIWWKRL